MADITNVKIGATDVTFNSVNIGHTKGGCEVVIETEKAEITVDETGNTVRDFSLLGEKVSVKVRMAETDVVALKNASPMGTLENTNQRLKIGKVAGERFAAQAAELQLRPVGNVDDSEDVVLYSAVATGDMTLAYTNEEERIVEVEFIGLWDETKNAIGHIGAADTA